MGTRDAEQAKWDQYYASLPVAEESPLIRACGEELSSYIEELLPAGGKIIEAGCGAGWQSLALARTGRFQVSLLDFSREALAHARQLFEREAMPAHFLEGDVFESGAPDFDLVFNAGVLEHYTFDEQVAFLHGMASRSRNYVLVLVPNELCYWYWLWRVHEVSVGRWPYGKEVPFVDIYSAFEAAGIHLIGQAFIASNWTESFIHELPGISDDVRHQIIEIHRSALSIPEAQKSYLVAFLGSVAPEQQSIPARWSPPPFKEDFGRAELNALLADGLSLKIGADNALRRLQTQFDEQVESFAAERGNLQAHISERAEAFATERAQLQTRISEQAEVFAAERAQLQARISEQEEALQLAEYLLARHHRRMQKVEESTQKLQRDLEDLEKSTGAKEQAWFAERDNLIAQLNVYYGTKAWRWTYSYWRVRRDGMRGLFRVLLKGSAFIILSPVLLVYFFIRLFYHMVIPKKLRLTLWEERHKLLRGQFSGLMSWYAYAFDTYRRERMSSYKPDLSSLRCPGTPGLVSIVLPVYNCADMVRQSLDSILSQTYAEFELIAINDGSTDETGQILEEYARRDQRIRVVHQENRKIPRTLSRGFQMARGEFLTWTSGDNRMKPEFLARMVGCLNRHPDWDMIYANLDVIAEDGGPLRNSEWYALYQEPSGSEHIHLPVDPSELNVWPNNYVGAAFLYRNRVAALLGDYSPARFTCEDYDYWMRINDLGTLRHADFHAPVYDYRFHPKSLTAHDKELGITRDRMKLMVFEDFRRDFCLMPLIWFFDGAVNDPSSPPVARLKSQIAAANHLLRPAGQLLASSLPRLGLPAVYLRFADNASQLPAPPDHLPSGILKVLALYSCDRLPEQISSEWDMCVAIGTATAPVPLLKAYQGWFVVPEVETLFAAVDMKVRSQYLSQYEAEISPARPASYRITVVICAFKRKDLLARSVTSIAHQTLPLEHYEVVIVNNDPEDAEVVHQVAGLRANLFAEHPENLRLIDCPIRGLSYARNVGVAEARGEVICFLDDDAIAHEDWLQNIWSAFEQHPEVGVIGGTIQLRIPDPRPTALQPGWEKYWSQFLSDAQDYAEVEQWWQFPWGANWSARRQALMEVGGFRTRYGRRGHNFGGGEEIVAAVLIQRLGYKVAIVPQAKVMHDVDQKRYTIEHVKRTIMAGTLVNYQAQKDLYFPMEVSLSTTLQRIFKTPIDSSIGSRTAKFREHIFRRMAYAQLLKNQVKDLRARKRKPVALAEKPGE